MDAVKPPSQVRDRRTRRAAETRRRILDAAGELFSARGYAATTIEAIADAADVAVETVYSRFGNKRTLLSDYLDVAIAGDDDPIPILERPVARALADEPDQNRQVEIIAALARDILERTAPAHRVLRGAAATDRNLEDLVELNDTQRRTAQRAFLTMIANNGPLRPGVAFDDLCDTYSAIASPDSYAFLTQRCGWPPKKFQTWVADTLSRLVLP